MPLNFLHPFRFIRRLPTLASPPLLTFLLFQSPNSPYINNFLHPKKHVQVQKKKAPRSKTSSPMWAPIAMEFPPDPTEARSTKQVHGTKKRNRCQKQLIWLSKKIPWVQHKYMQHMKVQKKYIPTGSRKHTSKSPTFLGPPGPKKILPGPKNMYRSKTRVPRSKKHASHQ